MTRADIEGFIREKLPMLIRSAPASDAGFALPDASLALLAEAVAQLGVRRVFEFGSGQSTRCFLDAGCTVSLVEDSAEWLEQTLSTIAPSTRDRLATFRLPLRTAWLAGAPIRSWALPPEALVALRDAELVLIDSPPLPPSREHALALTLATARNTLTIVDDAGIPTVARFCRRLAERNGAVHAFARIDHGLFFCAPISRARLDASRSLVETLKTWRRHFHPRGGA